MDLIPYGWILSHAAIEVTADGLTKEGHREPSIAFATVVLVAWKWLGALGEARRCSIGANLGANCIQVCVTKRNP